MNLGKTHSKHWHRVVGPRVQRSGLSAATWKTTNPENIACPKNQNVNLIWSWKLGPVALNWSMDTATSRSWRTSRPSRTWRSWRSWNSQTECAAWIWVLFQSRTFLLWFFLPELFLFYCFSHPLTFLCHTWTTVSRSAAAVSVARRPATGWEL